VLGDVLDASLCWLVVDELARLQIRQYLFESDIRALGDLPQQAKRRFSADHGERL
jgi:hypothetical protein